MRYCLPEIPSQYWLTELHTRCRKCGTEFAILIPEGADVVKLREDGGNTIKWLPMYGLGGYLDLLTKLVPGHRPDTEITMRTVRILEEMLVEVAEKSERGRPFRFDHVQRTCPACGSTEIEELGETVLVNPPLDWLKVSCSLTEPFSMNRGS